MQPAPDLHLVLVTAPDLDTARQLADAALEARLVACANILPGLESHYWWQGKLEHSPEVLLLLKTTASNLQELEQLILSRHPYDTPEFITLPVTAATPKYLDWWRSSTRRS